MDQQKKSKPYIFKEKNIYYFDRFYLFDSICQISNNKKVDYKNYLDFNISLKHIFSIGDKLEDIDGEDREGWGIGTIEGIYDEFLSVKFPKHNTKLTVLVTSDLYTYDRENVKGAKKCKIIKENNNG